MAGVLVREPPIFSQSDQWVVVQVMCQAELSAPRAVMSMVLVVAETASGSLVRLPPRFSQGFQVPSEKARWMRLLLLPARVNTSSRPGAVGEVCVQDVLAVLLAYHEVETVGCPGHRGGGAVDEWGAGQHLPWCVAVARVVGVGVPDPAVGAAAEHVDACGRPGDGGRVGGLYERVAHSFPSRPGRAGPFPGPGGMVGAVGEHVQVGAPPVDHAWTRGQRPTQRLPTTPTTVGEPGQPA